MRTDDRGARIKVASISMTCFGPHIDMSVKQAHVKRGAYVPVMQKA